MTTNPILKLRALLAALVLGSASAQPIANDRYTLEPAADGAVRLTTKDTGSWLFRGDFAVLVAKSDPKPAMRPGNIPRISYNLVTWQSAAPSAGSALQKTKRAVGQAGDGFGDRILEGRTDQRTADLFAAAPVTQVKATGVRRQIDALEFTLAPQDAFALTARLTLPPGDAEPVLTFTLTPRTDGWFSVGYTGAPAHPLAALAEVWQPFIWQEKRFPTQSILTPAFQCSLPATFVRKGDVTLGVVADADEFPFSPLPLLDNSRFGVALRNTTGEAQPMVFAPMLGGAESKRTRGQAFTFKLRLFAGAGDITQAYETLARRLYGFRDHRRNAIATLNETLDNMIDYGMSRYSWFIDELKGCSYSTDVPGAVKNVSSLNPLNLALIADDEEIFNQRAYPIVEYMLSREKFLFSLDPKQKIQSPSRLLLGPCAPVSELAALYGITHGASPVLGRMAKQMLGRDRILNLDDVVEGGTWQNQLGVALVTGDAALLAAARRGADAYLAARVDRPATGFDEGGTFFWIGFAPKWIDLFRLYEATGEPRYLAAARQGARQYTQFTWVAPRIPDEEVTVNPGGQAPVYWYLKGKGHTPMSAPEERVPAWRLSEIGLTPESSGTMSGHRAIFMANYAPWMLRIAALTGDQLLHDVARSAVVGRYRNFPGYHINTARTTIYERADYPLRDHKTLSVNSFHYNHIWPHMSILLDFLVTDAFARSGGKIDFPAHFIEGYAYLQSKFYGDRPGKFFDRDDAVLWLPRRLIKSSSVEINTLVARGRDRVYLAFTNQSPEPVSAEITLSATTLPQVAGQTYRTRVFRDGSATALRDGRLTVTIPPMGLTAVEVEGLVVTPKFQDRLVGARATDAWRRDHVELPFGGTRAMILNFGPAATTAYIYLQADDSKFKEVALSYAVGDRKATLTDTSYPFEFTVPLPVGAASFDFEVLGVTPSGEKQSSGAAVLQR